MRSGTLTLIALAIIWPANIARADVREECQAAPAPTEAMMSAYLVSGPYAQGLRLFQKGKYRKAALSLQRAWERIQTNLRSAFGTEKCRSKPIAAALKRNIRRIPPLAVVASDRFLPPFVVREAVANALCVSGHREEAVRWLMNAALSGDQEAAASASRMLGDTGRDHRPDALDGGGRTDKP